MDGTHDKPGKLSYLCPTRTSKLLDKTIRDLVDEAGLKYRNNIGLIVPGPNGSSFTFAEIQSKVKDIAAGFESLGFKGGDSIGFLAQNSPECYLASLAAASVGIKLVELGRICIPKDLIYYLNSLEVKGIMFGTRDSDPINLEQVLSSPLFQELRHNHESSRIELPSCPTLSIVITFSEDNQKDFPGSYSIENIRKMGQTYLETTDLKSRVDPEDIMFINFTTGTTGKPKQMARDHHSLVNCQSFLGKRFEYSPRDKIYLDIVDLSLHMSYAYGIIPALHYGSKVLIPNHELYNRKSLIQTIASEKCTIFYGFPKIHKEILNEPILKTMPMSSLRLVFIGSAPTDIRLLRTIREEYPVPFIARSYGLTEVGSVTQSLLDDSQELQECTVGYPSECMEIKVVGTDGKMVPVGAEGELCVRGTSVLKGPGGYPLLDSGNWFHTGDKMVMLSSGHVQHIGRKADTMLIHTRDIDPLEVETLLNTHPKIKESHVFSITLEFQIQEIVAWIILEKGIENGIREDEVRAFCKGKLLPIKIPKHILFVETIPVNNRGKVEKNQMREITIQKLFNL